MAKVGGDQYPRQHTGWALPTRQDENVRFSLGFAEYPKYPCERLLVFQLSLLWLAPLGARAPPLGFGLAVKMHLMVTFCHISSINAGHSRDPLCPAMSMNRTRTGVLR